MVGIGSGRLKYRAGIDVGKRDYAARSDRKAQQAKRYHMGGSEKPQEQLARNPVSLQVTFRAYT
jgi:hypothetical protein